MSEPRPPGSFATLLERFRKQARSGLRDSAGVERVIAKARARVERHRTLREELDPLLRLVRSYAKGSYRSAGADDVAWALAAVTYVATPIDAIPDYWPGGLRDDEAVVVWTTRKIGDELARYFAWEASIGEASMDEVVGRADAASDLTTLEVQVLEPVDALLFNRVDEGHQQTSFPLAL